MSTKNCKKVIKKWKKILNINPSIRFEKLKTGQYLAESEVKGKILFIYLRPERTPEEKEADILHELVHYKFKTYEKKLFNFFYDMEKISESWSEKVSCKLWDKYDWFVDTITFFLLQNN